MEAYSDDRSRALLTHILGPWTLGVARLAVEKWVLPTNVPPSCAFDGDGHICGSFAVGGCHICGRPICMSHALIAGDATLVCWTCLRTAAKYVKPWKPAIAEAPQLDLDWAYEILGVTSTTPLSDVRKAFKQRIAQFHPDVQKGGESKAHTDLTRLLTRAFSEIKKSKK